MNLNSASIGIWRDGDLVLSQEGGTQQPPQEDPRPPFYTRPRTPPRPNPPPTNAGEGQETDSSPNQTS
ncbi:hypothetical protein L209DRAFT_696974 [Thermothelomyces heterothallicus CBS 203.75]